MDYMDMLKGGLLGLTTDTLGAPVDLATMAMRPMGYNVQKPVMGSDWLADKLSSQPYTGAGQAARVVGGLLSPDPMDAVKLAGLLGSIKFHGSRSSDLFDVLNTNSNSFNHDKFLGDIQTERHAAFVSNKENFAKSYGNNVSKWAVKPKHKVEFNAL